MEAFSSAHGSLPVSEMMSCSRVMLFLERKKKKEKSHLIKWVIKLVVVIKGEQGA